MKPILSVLCAVKNLYQNSRVDSFKRLFNSVKDFSEIEFIVKDGCSKDGTIELLQQLDIRFYSSKDKNIYDAFNQLVSFSNGKYLLFLGSDDYIYNRKNFSHLLKLLNKSSFDLLYSPVYTDMGIYKNNSLKKIIKGMCLCHQGVIVSRTATVECDNFDTSLKYSADYHLILKIILSGHKVFRSRKPFSYFSMSGVTSIYGDAVKEEEDLIISKLFNLDIVDVQKFRSNKSANCYIYYSFFKRIKYQMETTSIYLYLIKRIILLFAISPFIFIIKLLHNNK